MDTYRKAINELERGIQRNTASIQAQLQKLGEHLSCQDAGAFPSREMADLHRRIGELREQLPKSRQQVKRILQCVARHEELEREIKARKSRAAELEESILAICEQIGQAAYTAYKNAAPDQKKYRELFAPLLKLEQELEELESEYAKLQRYGKDGNFFRIFRESGRSLYLKGLRSLKRKGLAKVYREVGKRLCESDLAEELKDAELRQALQPYQATTRKLSSLNVEVDRFRTDQEELWRELKELGAGKSHQKRVREIEIGIRRIEEELEDACEGLGALYRSKPLERFRDDVEVAACLKKIAQSERSTKQSRKQIERLEAAIRIDILQRQVHGLQERIGRLEKEIQVRLDEAQRLKVQIAEAEKQLQKLVKIRGSEHTLRKYPEGNGREARS